MPTPIKRKINLVALSKDHHDALLACFKLRQGVKKLVEPLRMANFAQWFWNNHMEQHFKEEEELLFIDKNDSLIAKALQEHSELKILFNNADENAEFLKMASLLDDHVRFEERVLFPHLEARLDEQALAAIGEALSVHKSCAIKYDDEFWV